jgi:hypothetical protein
MWRCISETSFDRSANPLSAALDKSAAFEADGKQYVQEILFDSVADRINMKLWERTPD